MVRSPVAAVRASPGAWLAVDCLVDLRVAAASSPQPMFRKYQYKVEPRTSHVSEVAFPVDFSRWPGNAAKLLSGSAGGRARSEEHTSELQSRENLVCRPLL